MTAIVLDTNVMVSAMLAPRGNEAVVLRLALAGEFLICVSPELLAEYEDVLRRPRLGIPSTAVQSLLSELRSKGKLVHPKTVVHASPDEEDNRFLECAEAARALYLVTGNKRHFPKAWKQTRVVNARELIEETIPI
jgi:putative PIN family toxin of toxin-antitoxin system